MNDNSYLCCVSVGRGGLGGDRLAAEGRVVRGVVCRLLTCQHVHRSTARYPLLSPRRHCHGCHTSCLVRAGSPTLQHTSQPSSSNTATNHLTDQPTDLPTYPLCPAQPCLPPSQAAAAASTAAGQFPCLCAPARGGGPAGVRWRAGSRPAPHFSPAGIPLKQQQQQRCHWASPPTVSRFTSLPAGTSSARRTLINSTSRSSAVCFIYDV